MKQDRMVKNHQTMEIFGVTNQSIILSLNSKENSAFY